MYEAFPLMWPAGYPRSEKRYSSSFKLTANKAREVLLAEIKRISGDLNPIISSNVPLRKSDGQMYSDVASDKLSDPGVAVYFKYKNRQISLACDKWETPAENVRALALTIEAMRGMERWGCSQILERSFTGFAAIPQTTSAETEIWKILGLKGKPDNTDKVQDAYRARLKIDHPDKATGSNDAFIKLQAAYKTALNLFKTES